MDNHPGPNPAEASLLNDQQPAKAFPLFSLPLRPKLAENCLLHDRQRAKAACILSLPVELRRMIYEYILLTPATLRLLDQVGIVSDAIGIRVFEATALLQTCHKIYDEAARVFYEGNVFHLEVFVQEPFLGMWNTFGLSMMRNISIGCSLDWFYLGSCYDWDCDCVDLAVAGYVGGTLEKCLSLRALAVHYMSFVGLVSLVHIFSGRPLGVEIMSKLKARLDQITLVAPATVKAMGEFGALIAPLGEWDVHKLLDWPQISLSVKQHKNIRKNIDDYNELVDWDERIPGEEHERRTICTAIWQRKAGASGL